MTTVNLPLEQSPLWKKSVVLPLYSGIFVLKSLGSGFEISIPSLKIIAE